MAVGAGGNGDKIPSALHGIRRRFFIHAGLRKAVTPCHEQRQSRQTGRADPMLGFARDRQPNAATLRVPRSKELCALLDGCLDLLIGRSWGNARARASEEEDGSHEPKNAIHR
jgi:hypothetical protein